MVDVFDAAKRSWVMSRIRGRDTKPERKIRSLLHRLGFRFTVSGPGNRRLPGKPDIVLPKYRTVVFVHGCFWHGHEGCKHYRIPKTRTDWWRAKIRGNRLRDLRNQNDLEALGWRVVVIWTCDIDNRGKLDALAVRLPQWIRTDEPERNLPMVAEEPPPYASERESGRRAET